MDVSSDKNKMSINSIISLLLLFGVFAVSEGKSLISITKPNRPPYHEYAEMARYLVNKSNWTSMGTISNLSTIYGFPMVNVISIADSALNAPSTGRIYFLLTDLDFTGQDLSVQNKLTALFSEDQDLACTSNGTDTMEPICARVIITGKMRRLNDNTKEYSEADEAYTSRHPASMNWRKSHRFYFCTMDIDHIAVLDFYGGAHLVSAEDYYNANFDSNDNYYYYTDKVTSSVQPSVITPKN